MFWGSTKKEKSDYTTRDFYKYYTSKSESPVDRSTFSKIINEYFEYRMQLLIFENIDFKLPNRFGTICIRGVCDSIYIKSDGTVRYFIDWGATNKLWEEKYKGKTPEEIKKIKNKPVVYFTNENTNGRIYDFIWDKLTCNFKYHTHYKFKPTRKWKRKLKDFLNNSKNIIYYDKG